MRVLLEVVIRIRFGPHKASHNFVLEHLSLVQLQQSFHHRPPQVNQLHVLRNQGGEAAFRNGRRRSFQSDSSPLLLPLLPLRSSTLFVFIVQNVVVGLGVGVGGVVLQIIGEMLLEQVIDFDPSNRFPSEERVKTLVADDSLLLGRVEELALVDVISDDGSDVVLGDLAGGVPPNRIEKFNERLRTPAEKLLLLGAVKPLASSRNGGSVGVGVAGDGVVLSNPSVRAHGIQSVSE